jgi:hypothetical protein
MSVSFTGFTSAPATAMPTKPSTAAVKPAEAKSAEQNFLDYAKMTPAERLHARMLAELGVTEDQFKAMSPAEQQKIEDKIREMIKQQAANSSEKSTGLITDKSV